MAKNDVVVDANILISALLGSRRTIALITSPEYHFYAPRRIVDELLKNKDVICSKAFKTPVEFEIEMWALLRFVSLLEYSDYSEFVLEARNAIAYRDVSDVDFLACALAIKAEFIWTEDKDFTAQKLIPVKSTAQFMMKMRIFKYLNYLISSKMRER